MHEIKMLHGIDSLYYFCESNDNYDNLYLEITEEVEEKEGMFKKKDIAFENCDIHISINSIPLNYLGKEEGFYWFKDINEFFKIGFKDKYKNRGLNDIRVQLQDIRIYTVGIKSLNEFINNFLLADYVTGASSGNGAVREACELLMGLNGNFNEVITERKNFSETYSKYLAMRKATTPTYYTSQDGGVVEVKP